MLSRSRVRRRFSSLAFRAASRRDVYSMLYLVRERNFCIVGEEEKERGAWRWWCRLGSLRSLFFLGGSFLGVDREALAKFYWLVGAR